MGDSFKAIVGIALMLAAPGIGAWAAGGAFAWGATIASLSGIGLATAIGVTLVAASLAGSALTPELGDTAGVDSYSGQKLQTQKSNVNPVPQIFGFNRLAGNIIYQKTNAAVNSDDSTNGYNRDYWAIIALAGHTIEDITGIYAGATAMTSLGSNKFQTDYAHVKWYDAAATATNVQAVDFVTNTAGSTSTGATLSLDSVDIPANTAFLAVHQVFDGEENKSTQMANLTVLMKGKKIRTITNATTISTAKTYTTNPAEVVLDLLTDGLNIADANIDIDSFYTAKTSCTTNAWNVNLAVMQQANIQSIISDVLATCRGQIVHSANKWKLKIDSKSQTIVDTLTDDDFINNSLNISMKGNRDIANKIIFKYINPDDEWLSAQVVKEDSALQTFDGQTLEKTLDVKGITDSTQAGELAEITLNSMRYTENSSGTRVKQTPLALSFATSVKNAHLEVGDVITINSDLLDRNRNFIILSVETDQSGLIQITSREYAETHYKNSAGTYLI